MGSDNPSAKKIIAINHNNNNKYLIYGEIIKFCNDFNLSYSVYKNYVNNGIFTTSPSNYLKNKKTENTLNWEFLKDVDETKYNELIEYHHLSTPSE